MNTTRMVLVLCLLLGGCGSCQRSEEVPAGSGRGAVPGAPSSVRAPAGAPAGGAPGAAPGKIRVAPIEPNVAVRKPQAAEGEAPQPAPGGEGEAPQPEAGWAGKEPEHGEGDCVVVADVNPDFGPPPLAVAFTAEAECGEGQPKYRWNFGDGSPGSTEANPAHTYTQPGDYTASVTVTGPGGSASDEVDISVEED